MLKNTFTRILNFQFGQKSMINPNTLCSSFNGINSNSQLLNSSIEVRVVPVRHRYESEYKPVYRRYGYEDKLDFRGLIPRPSKEDQNRRLPIPPYCPKNSWNEKSAVFGQNDYIDILGDGSIHPSQISYSVPPWMRGIRLNTEYHMLLRKKKFFAVHFQRGNPETYHNLLKRIRFLHRYMNRKLRFRYDPTV